jgi:hypothetical protein
VAGLDRCVCVCGWVAGWGGWGGLLLWKHERKQGVSQRFQIRVLLLWHSDSFLDV